MSSLCLSLFFSDHLFSKEKTFSLFCRCRIPQIISIFVLKTYGSVRKVGCKVVGRSRLIIGTKSCPGFFFSSIDYLPKYYCCVGHFSLLRWPSIIAALAKYTVMLRNRIFRLIRLNERAVCRAYYYESSRSGNESFLTYFRFLPSHTTVHAVRHTAV